MTAPPEPLVPADCDIRDLDGFMLNTDRLMASELWALSTGEEFKAAVALWCRAWKQQPPGSLPDDDRVLAAFSCTGLRWKKLKAMALRGFVKCSDGRLYHTVLCEDVVRAARKKVERAERTRAATQARKRQRDVQRNVERDEHREVVRNDLPGTGQGQDSKRSPLPPSEGSSEIPALPPSRLTPTAAAVTGDDQAVLDAGVETLERRDKLSHHTAQTYLASRCKLHGTSAVVAALRDMATTPVAAPRAWLDARLENAHGNRSRGGAPSAVERVRAAAAEREAAAAAAGQDY